MTNIAHRRAQMAVLADSVERANAARFEAAILQRNREDERAAKRRRATPVAIGERGESPAPIGR